MKKIMALLTAALLLLSLTACGKEEEPIVYEDPVSGGEYIGEETVGEMPLLGGWTLNGEIPVCELPAGVAEAFEAAMTGFTGVGFRPLVFLGTRDGSGASAEDGTVYAILCYSTGVYPGAETSLSILWLGKEDGSWRVTGNQPFPAEDLVGSGLTSNAGMTADSSWTYCDSNPEAQLEETARSAFDTAFRDFAGPAVTPVALLGTQVVSGTNYAFLCTGRTTAKDAPLNFYVFTIYRSWDGSAEVLSGRLLDLAEILGE